MDFDIRTEEPAVSVCLITYNHAPYIRECLDSILAQRTDFPFEICLGEDESTDGTREICVEYAEKHPDRIRLFLRSQSEPGRGAYMSQGVYNHIRTMEACRGKYMAWCDGDDAWIDSLKLQKQFDAMESDPGLSLVHSDFDKLDEISGCRIDHVCRRRPGDYRQNPDPDLLRYDIIQQRYLIAASTAFMRTRDALEISRENGAVFQSCPMGDVITWCELLDHGSFLRLEESTSIYRILPESDSNSVSAKHKLRFTNGAANLGIMLGERYGLPMDRVRENKIKHCNRYALLSGDFSEIRALRADADYRFSLVESCIYHAGRWSFPRAAARKIFEWRYRSNNRQFNRKKVRPIPGSRS